MLRAVTERFPSRVCGLSLSLADRPIWTGISQGVGALPDEHQALHYSEHLSYSGDDGHLYDLLPIPFTKAAVEHRAAHPIVQDILRRPR